MPSTVTIPNFAWKPSSKARYTDQLEVLYPAAWLGRAFLMGEAADHDGEGKPRYHAHLMREGTYLVGSRPVTVEEFKILVQAVTCARCRLDLIRFTREVRLPRFTMQAGEDWHLPLSYRHPDGTADLGAGIVPADAYETVNECDTIAVGCCHSTTAEETP